MAGKPSKIDDVKHPEKVVPSTTSRPIVVTSRPILTNDPMMVSGATSEEPRAAEPIVRTAKTIKPLDATLRPAGETPAAGPDTAAEPAKEPAKEPTKEPTEEPVKESVDEPGASTPPAAPIFELPVADATADTPADDTVVTGKPADMLVADVPAADAKDTKANESSAQLETAPQEAAPETASVEAGPTSSGANAAAAPVSATADQDVPATDSTPQPADDDEAMRDPEAQATAEEAAALEAKTAREQELEQLIASGQYFVPINAVRRKRSRIFVLVWFLLALVLAAALLDVLLDTGLLQLPIGLNVPHTDFFSAS